MISKCLTFEELQAYSEHNLRSSEINHLYLHISSCEMCACAVNGFTALPFASDELVAIHCEIDAKTNATAVKPLTFAQVLIVTASACSIIMFNLLCVTHSGEIHHSTSPAITISKTSNHETEKASKKEVSAVTKSFKKAVNVSSCKNLERNVTPIERLDLIKPSGINESNSQGANADIIAPRFDSDVIYIYGLKVSDYNNLYFTQHTAENSLFKSHTPVFKENEKSKNEESGQEQRLMPADRILKDGLASFNKQKFSSAIANFELLLEFNTDDVNAQFYSALAYYNLNKQSKAVEYLNKVFENTNPSFHPEAQWFLALVALKSGNKEDAKRQLRLIASEKGFYSNRAAEKLQTLN